MSSKNDKFRGKYFIAFYDKTDEEFLYSFDNIREICKFMKKPLTRRNLQEIYLRIYRALKTDTHFVTFLTGEVMRVYLIDIEDEE